MTTGGSRRSTSVARAAGRSSRFTRRTPRPESQPSTRLSPRAASTTLLDPQVDLLQFLDAFEKVRLLRKQERREDLLDNGTNAGKRQRVVRAGSHPLPLEECVGDSGEHDVMLPPRIRAAFEVVEAEFGFELLILLLDRPALMRESDQLLHRRGRGHVDEKVFRARRGAEILFAQEPHLGCELSMAPVGGGRDTDSREAGRPRAIRTVAPRHPSPG